MIIYALVLGIYRETFNLTPKYMKEDKPPRIPKQVLPSFPPYFFRCRYNHQFLMSSWPCLLVIFGMNGAICALLIIVTVDRTPWDI